MKKSHSDFIKEVKDLVGNEYTILSKYEKSNIKLKIRHNCSKCNNYEYEVTPNVFLRGRRCPKCNGGVAHTHLDFIKEVEKLVGNEYTILSTYQSTSKKIKIRHNCSKCNNYEYEVTPRNFKAGDRCPKCYGNIKRTLEDFKKKVYELVKDEYTIIGEYKNNKTKIGIKHNLCGKSYFVIPKDFTKKDGNRCPFCKSSKGELEIKRILEKYDVLFDWKFKDEMCKSKKVLEFDFKIYYDDGSYAFIEYDGNLHYKPWKKDKESKIHLEQQKINDKIKDDFCKENNIFLLRIPYWNFNEIEKILVKEFNLV